MKNKILPVMIAGLFILVACDKYEPAEFGMIGTQKLTPNITVIQAEIVDFYLFKDGKDSIIIDTGYNPDVITNQFKKAGVNQDSISWVFLTHSDFDHVLGLGFFSNAQVYMSAAEEQMVNGRKARSGWLYHNQPLPYQYTLLKDGEIVRCGKIKVKLILTPGHTLGSACYLVNDRYLFTGDTLSIKNGKVAPFFKKFNMNTDQQILSIRKLAAYPGISNVKMILTGHSGIATNVLGAFAPWR